jgi:hypothetical protein
MWWSFLCPFGADALRQSLKHGVSGSPRSVDSRRPAIERLNRPTVNYRSRDGLTTSQNGNEKHERAKAVWLRISDLWIV